MPDSPSNSKPPAAPADATAQVVDSWRRLRPDLDVSPLEVFSRVTRLAKYLDHIRAAAFARHHLQGWEFDVLAELRRAGPPHELTPGQMSAQMLVSSGTMTNRIDRLQAARLVQRREDREDRRVTRVRLTRAGQARVDAAIADLVRREAELWAPLAPGGRSAAAAALAALLGPLEAAPPAQRPSA
ncbi:MAG: MarR family winged helix-turn-helix transcriptional regulator [Bifidobacteriaceae bacterium]|nr:MarR family winged helix-turn-helix transcriptional regulator [Bifidobacteriaceae bacterium]